MSAQVEGTGNEQARALNAWAVQALSDAGRRLGFEVTTEYPIPGGRMDVVWLAPLPQPLPGWEGQLPLVGFEVESSWRTRKHVKGDLLNLQDLGASLGVIVLLGDGEKVAALRRFAEQLVDRPQARILIWSEAEIRELGNGGVPAAVAVPPAPSLPPAEEEALEDEEPLEQEGFSAVVTHTGKYQPLWRWLIKQSSDSVELTFAEIEEILGFPLPASSRRHAPHWHSYEGSAVARAIIDAGWRARRLDLTRERVTLVREAEV